MVESQTHNAESFRPSIESLAYRMLGSWSDAQDVAQETLVKWHLLGESARLKVHEPQAWLHKVGSRLALDRLKSAQRQRERYVGPWLPEPLLTSDFTPADAAGVNDSITLALLFAMERLTPAERAAFILRDVFDYPFDDIADILEKQEPTCRQLVSRARKALRSPKRQPETVAPETHQKLLEAFLTAASQGDSQQLETLLAEDVVMYADGGAHARAARKPLHSRDIVTRFFVGLARKFQKSGSSRSFAFTTLNGQPAALISTDGRLDTVFSIEIQGDQIQTIYQQRNPEKLKHLISQ